MCYVNFSNIILLTLALKHKKDFNIWEWKTEYSSNTQDSNTQEFSLSKIKLIQRKQKCFPCVPLSSDILQPFPHPSLFIPLLKELKAWTHFSQMFLPSGSSLKSASQRPLNAIFLAEARKGQYSSCHGRKTCGLPQRARRQMWWFFQHFLEPTYIRATGSEDFHSGSLRFLTFLTS